MEIDAFAKLVKLQSNNIQLGRPWRIKITKKSLNDGKSNTVKLCFDEKNRACNSTSGARKN